MPVNSFKWKHYVGEIILLNVRYILKYIVSYTNLKEMVAERGTKVNYTTIVKSCKEILKKALGSKHNQMPRVIAVNKDASSRKVLICLLLA